MEDRSALRGRGHEDSFVEEAHALDVKHGKYSAESQGLNAAQTEGPAGSNTWPRLENPAGCRREDLRAKWGLSSFDL